MSTRPYTETLSDVLSSDDDAVAYLVEAFDDDEADAGQAITDVFLVKGVDKTRALISRALDEWKLRLRKDRA